MNGMNVNFEKKAIEMNKTFAKAAQVYGSDEYVQLVDTKRDFPDFKIKVVAPKKAGSQFRGLTIAYMEKYICQHDDADNTTLKTFATLRGMALNEKNELVENTSKEFKSAATYGEIKLWFLETYHEAFDNNNSEAKAIVKKAKTDRTNRLAN